MRYILTHHNFHSATNEKIMEYGKMFGGIRIAYGSDSANKKMSRANELFSWIKEDYPNVNEDDVDILVLTRNESDWLAHKLILSFLIPAEEFIRLRRSGKIHRI